jgi:acyl carrier protein
MLHTLQTRRDAMDERLAVVAESREELLEKLQRIRKTGSARRGDLEAQGIYFGNVGQSRANSFIRVVTGEVTGEIVQRHSQKRNWNGLAQLWVNGAQIDWRELWQHQKPQHVSLPAYPFARERHWLEFAQVSSETTAGPAALPVSAPASNDDAACDQSAMFHEPPRSDTEKSLVALWAELLQRPPAEVGIYDNFFELGGDSLLATQVVSRMRSQLEINLPLIAFLNVSTIAGAAEVIASINYQRDGEQDELLDDGDEEGSIEEGSVAIPAGQLS